MLPTIPNLPDFLEVDDGGFISLKGNRIGLHHVVREYDAGLSAERILARFPTLELARIYRVLTYLLENEQQVRGYCRAHDGDMDKLEREHVRKGPTLAELKQRAALRSRPQAG
jgi:uncharacterized protein (DUF433 family)